MTAVHRNVLARAAYLAEAGGWTPKAVGTMLAGLHRLLSSHTNARPILRSEVQAQLRSAMFVNVAADVLQEHGMPLDDDVVPTIRTWIDSRSDELPEGFRDDVRAWLLELHAGGDRVRPRSRATLYAYLGRVQPHLLTWSATRRHLREVTEDDVIEVFDSQRGHQRAGTFTSLRSLFKFAKRHRLIFVDPTHRLHVGRAPKRTAMPMTDDEFAAVKRAAVTAVQRLIVALVAVYAARSTTIRLLTLDDVDLTRRCIRIGGTTHQMPDLVHRLLTKWLVERQRTWPHTPNRQVLVSFGSAAGIGPVTDYYLTCRLSMQDVRLEHLRADRVLHEALTVDADPLHLAAAFNLSDQTAIDYSEMARNLLSRPVEDQLPGNEH
ncbi:hypothetical protein ACIRG5_45585 [Lentzea sp. NPDC102401]|uniref:hypothetical protein n=1 Tax=Lentzea sp. NPDC102401 TaxID=3364128 RepID=UPI003814C051